MAVTSGNGEFDKLARDNTSYREPIGSRADPSRSTCIALQPIVPYCVSDTNPPGSRCATPHPAAVLHSPFTRAAPGRLSALCATPRVAGASRGSWRASHPLRSGPGATGRTPSAAGPDAARRLRASVSPVRPARSWPCLPPRTLAPTLCRTESITAIGERKKCHRRENPCRRRMRSRPAGSAAKGQRGDCRTRRSKTPPCPLPNAARRAAWHRNHRPTAFGSGTAHPRRGPFPRCLISPVMS